MLDQRNHYRTLVTHLLKLNLLNKGIGSLLSVSLLFLAACETDMAEVQQLTFEDKAPREIQENVKLIYTDSAVVKMELQAPLAQNFPQLERPYLEFPKGIHVRFFDRFGKEESNLRADYAIRYPNEYFWEARGNVVVNNVKGEQLNTEELIWQEKEQKIRSTEFVKLTSSEEVIFGEGFEADQNFTWWRISKVTGQITLEEDEQ